MNPQPRTCKDVRAGWLALAMTLALSHAASLPAAGATRQAPAGEARQLLEMYNRSYQQLRTAAEGAAWDASTNVTEENTGKASAEFDRCTEMGIVLGA